MTHHHERYQKQNRRPLFSDGFFVLFVISIAGHCCIGMQIVVTIDNTSKLTAGDLQALVNFSSVHNASSIRFRLNHTMLVPDLTAIVNDWLTADNVTSIVDMTSDCRVTSVAALKGIPLVRASLVSCGDVMHHVRNIRVTTEVYVKAGFSFLESMGSCLARVVLLMERHADLSDFPKCYRGTAIPLLARVVGVWPLSDKQTNQTQSWLKGVGSRLSLHYMVVVGSSDFLNGIKTLGWFQLLPSTFHWVIVVTDLTSAFHCPSCSPRTLLFRPPSHEAWPPLPFPLQHLNATAELLYALEGLQQAMRLTDTPAVHVTHLTKHTNGSVEIDTDTAEQAKHRMFTNFTVEVDIVKENNTIEQLGTWTETGGLHVEGPMTDYLHDPSVIRVAVKESPPFAMRVTDENGTRYSGYAIDVLEEVARRLEFTYSFITDREDSFGARLDNGSWSGIIGDIMEGSVDLSVGPLTVTAEREAVVDFTTPFYEFAGIEILIKEVAQEQDLLFFVTVFSKPMWGAWFGVLLLTGFLLAAFDYFSPFSARNAHRSGKGKKEDREEEEVEKRNGGGRGGGGGAMAKETFDLKEGLWLVTASFTLSGPESTPRTLSSRVLVAGFWFFCSIIMANYTANLAAFLTTSRLTTPINSLQDLSAQSEVRYSVVRGSLTMTYFERMAKIESNFYELWKNISSNMVTTGDLSKSELAVWDYPLGDTYVKIWSDIERTGMLSSSQEGLERVMEGNFALIDEAPYLQYVISKHCGLTTIGKQFSTKSYAFALPQGSPLTEQISNAILQLQSETFLEKLKQKWWKVTATGCLAVDESDGLSFHTLGGVFLLAGVGLAAGLLLCLLETAWAWLSAWRRKQRSNMIPAMNSRADLIQDYDMGNSFECISAVDDRHTVHMSSF